jgi:hypothetical protein
MLCEVETPSRCIFLAEVDNIRQRRYRLENLDDTAKIKPERIEHLPSVLLQSTKRAGSVSPEKVASLTIRAHPPLLNVCINVSTTP